MKLILIFLLFIISATTIAQTTTGRINWNGYGEGINFIYTGEIKDGVPDGKGVAVSEGGGQMKYFGDFKQGKFEGTGVMLVDDGSIYMMTWKNNAANGMGVSVSEIKTLRYGMFANNLTRGKMIEVTKYGEIRMGELGEKGYEGRVLEIRQLGQYIHDNYWTGGRNYGLGYSIGIGVPKLFMGIFDDHFLRFEKPVNYPSFLRSDSLKVYQLSDKKWWIVSNTIHENGKMFPQDTCLYVDYETSSRKFGKFDHGMLTDGVNILNDSVSIIGHFKSQQLDGDCVFYKRDVFLAWGNFKEDIMNGQGVFVNIKDTIVTEGYFVNNALYGKGSVLYANNDLEIGNFKNGMLEGYGKKVRADGTFEAGIYVKGVLQSDMEELMTEQLKLLTRDKGINEAFNFLLGSCEKGFAAITGKEKPVVLFNSIVMINASYVFPGSSKNTIIKDTAGTYGNVRPSFHSYIGVYVNSADATKVYDKLCKQIEACEITSLEKGKTFKPIVGKRSTGDVDENNPLNSYYTFPDYKNKPHPPAINVKLEKNKDGRYSVELVVEPKL